MKALARAIAHRIALAQRNQAIAATVRTVSEKLSCLFDKVSAAQDMTQAPLSILPLIGSSYAFRRTLLILFRIAL